MSTPLQVEFLSRPESADSDMMGSESDMRSEGTAMSDLQSKDGGEETSSRPLKVNPLSWLSCCQPALGILCDPAGVGFAYVAHKYAV